MKILTENDVTQADISSIFFNRPVSAIRKNRVGILVGSQVNLFDLEQVFAIITAMDHHPVLIVDETLRSLKLPADIFLTTSKKTSVYQNSDEALELVSSCKLTIAGIGLSMNSAMQLFLDRILSTNAKGIVITDSVFTLPNLTSKLSKYNMLVGTTKKLLHLLSDNINRNSMNSGLLKKMELISSGVQPFRTPVLCIEDHQILGVNTTQEVTAIINSEVTINKNAYLAIFAGLCADSGSINDDWSMRVMAAGYLYKNVYAKNKKPREIREFLDSQF